ncbi:MAG: hypothetical protein KIS92_10090 [Planctomycetota bacterium]|nr:hypothetical protein [Planctomycetota bacterium]
MHAHGMKIGLAALAFLSLGLGGWSLSERSARQSAERAAALRQDQLETQGQELARVAKDGRETSDRLGAVQADLKRLKDQIAAETRAHREETDRMLAQKGELMKQLEELTLQLERTDLRNKNLAEDLRGALAGSRKLEDVLAAERAESKDARNALDHELRNARSETEKARREAKQTTEALKKSQKDSQDLAQDLQRTADAARDAEKENDQLSRDLQQVARDRDQATWSIQQYQAALNNAYGALRTREREIEGLRREIARIQQSNQNLQQQVAGLNAEVARLRKLLPPGTP